jgi:beta-N-acetylhexosaminidase
MTLTMPRFLILGFDGISPEPEFLKFIEENPPAGFLLLADNYKDEKQLGRLIADLKSITGEGVLIMTDQEPGRVQRFKVGFPISKKPSYYLKHGNADEYRSWCAGTAEKMADLGINVNLAPLVDLWPLDKDYPVLNDRVFGDEPEKVIEFAAILIEEFKKLHIHTCAKHFPGLGAARGDPHDVLSTSGDKLERFLDYHWRPFKVMARSDIDMIMTTHLLCPALDPENRATYSGNVLSHLRNTVGHKGLVITDDLYMAGAQADKMPEKATLDAIRAGHNLLIISRDLYFQRKAASALKKSFEEDEAFGKICAENETRLKALGDGC